VIKWISKKFNEDSGPPPLVKARMVRGGPEKLWCVDLLYGIVDGGTLRFEGAEFWWEWRVT
jgi:hypothetical protein